MNNWDIALLKETHVTESKVLEFRMETFNTFNHAQFGGVNIGCSGLTSAGAPCTGPNNIGNGEISYARSPRIMQLGLKFIF